MSRRLPDELKIAKEAGISVGGGVSGGFLRYLFNILVARLHGVEILGMYAITNAFFQIGTRIAALGLESGLVRYVARLMARDQKDVAVATVRKATLLGFISGIVVSWLLYRYADDMVGRWFPASMGQLPQLIRWFALSIPFTLIARMAAAASQGLKVLKHRVLALSILPMLILAVGLVLLSAWYDPIDAIGMAYFASQVVSMIAALLFLMPLLPVHHSQNVSSESGLLLFSLPLLGASVVAAALNWSDLLMLGSMIDDRTAGLYQPALRTATMLPVIASAFTAILAPLVSEHQASNNLPQIERLLKLTTLWTFIFLWPLLLLIMLYGSKIMLIFGGDFLQSAVALRLLALATFSISITLGLAVVVTMTGHPRFVLFNSVIALSVNIGLNLLLIPRYGLMGAAISTGTASLLIALLRIVQTWRLLHISPFSLGMLRPAVAGAAGWLACLAINNLIFSLHTVAVLILGGLLFMLVYLFVLWRLGMTEEEINVMNAAVRKIRRARN
ncbi:MAG: polysaccharide biosynthesis protein [Candidatus Marinimicrobia bacterium]|nr:polysaccharide biosynthesis protein [Candidatus Neomarinimicrobiota bacterium]